MVQFLPTSMCDTMAQSSKTGCWKLVQCVPSHFMSETQYTRGLVKCGNNSWQLPNMTFCHFQPKCVLQSDAMRHHFSVTKGTLESVCHLSEFKNPLPLRIISFCLSLWPIQLLCTRFKNCSITILVLFASFKLFSLFGPESIPSKVQNQI